MEKIWKKINVLFLLLIGLLSSIFPMVPLEAASATLNNINIIVDLKADGSARITQEWDINVSEGTELFIVQENLGDIEIKDFVVYDNTSDEAYTFISTGWNINANRTEKTRKNGFYKTEKGYELCWGIGEYGHRVYRIEYTMTNFVKSFTDYDGFNQQLLSQKMSPTPEHVTITIRSDVVKFNQINARIWAFGYTGQINFVDGAIVAKTTTSIKSSNYMTILVGIEKNIFSPTSQKTTTFEALRKTAFVGSDYQEEDAGTGSDVESPQANASSNKGNMLTHIIRISGFIIFDLIIIGGVLLFFLFRRKQRGASNIDTPKSTQTVQVETSDVKQTRQEEKRYYRDIPFEKNIIAATAGLASYGRKLEDGNIVGAYLLRWLRSDSVHIEETEVKRMFSQGIEATIHFLKSPTTIYQSEIELFEMLRSAAGRDGILQATEFDKWVSRNYRRLEKWQESFVNEGNKILNANGLMETETSSFLFWNHTTNKLTIKGYAEVGKAYGLERYLTDYSLIHERNPNEVQMWDDYLIFAALFGIADKVAAAFKKLYPIEFAYYEKQSSIHFDIDNSLRIVTTISHSYSSNIAAAKARGSSSGSYSSSGGGGSSSSSGGGGSSGGGSGGGVR